MRVLQKQLNTIQELQISTMLLEMGDLGKDIEVRPEIADAVIQLIQDKGFVTEVVAECDEYSYTTGVIWKKRHVVPSSVCISVAPTKEALDNREVDR